MLVSVSDDCTIKVWGPASEAEDATDYNTGAENNDDATTEIMNCIFQTDSNSNQTSSVRALLAGGLNNGVTPATALNSANLENLLNQSAAVPWYLLELGAPSGGSGSGGNGDQNTEGGSGSGGNAGRTGSSAAAAEGALNQASAYSSSSIGWL